MLRFVVLLLAIILIVPLIRAVVGLIVRTIADLLGRSSTSPDKSRRPDVPVAGELKKDPVCGTYVSTATAFQKAAGGETLYFCSRECRDKFKG
jgi:YHS domain-containing protein